MLEMTGSFRPDLAGRDGKGSRGDAEMIDAGADVLFSCGLVERPADAAVVAYRAMAKKAPNRVAGS